MVIIPENELNTQTAVIVRSDNFNICVIIGIKTPIANRLKTTPILSTLAYSSEKLSVPEIAKVLWHVFFQKMNYFIRQQ